MLCRFQYVLAAATSIATKVNEETLTYLNQGQSYEIKLKKLGDLTEYRGKILKVVRVHITEHWVTLSGHWGLVGEANLVAGEAPLAVVQYIRVRSTFGTE